MPGFNHYSNCTCGWCVKYGRPSGANRARVRQILQQAKVDCGWKCFVNPNAECPVCGDQVIYYENKFGSRVFFDSFGPEWRKHGCTDNAKRITTRRIKLRPISSINKRYFDEIFTLGLAPSRSETWLPAEILFVDRKSGVVELAISDGKKREEFELLWPTNSPIPLVGDLVCLTPRRLSYVRPDNLLRYTVPVQIRALAEKPTKKTKPITKKQQPIKSDDRLRKAKPSQPGNVSKAELTAALSQIGRVTDSDRGDDS